MIGQIGLLLFLFSVFPLLPSDGYRWLATYFGQPTLREDALASVPGRLSQNADEDEAASSSVGCDFLRVGYRIGGVAAGTRRASLLRRWDDRRCRVLTKTLLVGVCIALAAWIVALWKYGRGRTWQPSIPTPHRKC